MLSSINKVKPILAIIVPCFNEEQVVLISAQKLKKILNDLIAQSRINADSFIYFVDDGSQDKTWQIINRLHQENKQFKGLKLSRNFGHQNALLAGLTSAQDKADCFITIDADLQDDPQVIEAFMTKYQEGYSIVYGVRNNRQSDSWPKKTTANFFYYLMNLLSVKTIKNHGDYRLIDQKTLNQLLNFNEVNLFLRGLIPLLGFRSTKVFYQRQKRAAGKTKYNLYKMISLAWNGITSFSIAPLRILTLLGFLGFLVAIAMSIWVLVTFIQGKTIQGWSSVTLIILFIGSIQTIGIGLIGEYIGKIYKEVKARPRYIIEKEI